MSMSVSSSSPFPFFHNFPRHCTQICSLPSQLSLILKVARVNTSLHIFANLFEGAGDAILCLWFGVSELARTVAEGRTIACSTSVKDLTKGSTAIVTSRKIRGFCGATNLLEQGSSIVEARYKVAVWDDVEGLGIQGVNCHRWIKCIATDHGVWTGHGNSWDASLRTSDDRKTASKGVSSDLNVSKRARFLHFQKMFGKSCCLTVECDLVDGFRGGPRNDIV
mmetsp:Transcript_4432/g.6137  ORF Transcript_4432/g.6137 Transcript_4432/m.6137 type:complete len:222 (-) Transcript_4432:934-1599(-)